jgi:hypothetical protein
VAADAEDGTPLNPTRTSMARAMAATTDTERRRQTIPIAVEYLFGAIGRALVGEGRDAERRKTWRAVSTKLLQKTRNKQPLFTDVRAISDNTMEIDL